MSKEGRKAEEARTERLHGWLRQVEGLRYYGPEERPEVDEAEVWEKLDWLKANWTALPEKEHALAFYLMAELNYLLPGEHGIGSEVVARVAAAAAGNLCPQYHGELLRAEAERLAREELAEWRQA